jgi:hypothetical protein
VAVDNPRKAALLRKHLLRAALKDQILMLYFSR